MDFLMYLTQCGALNILLQKIGILKEFRLFRYFGWTSRYYMVFALYILFTEIYCPCNCENVNRYNLIFIST